MSLKLFPNEKIWNFQTKEEQFKDIWIQPGSKQEVKVHKWCCCGTCAQGEWRARGSSQQQTWGARSSAKPLGFTALQNSPYSWESHLSLRTGTFFKASAPGRRQLWTPRFTGTALQWLCGEHHGLLHLTSSASKTLVRTNNQLLLCCTSNIATCRLFSFFFFSFFLSSCKWLTDCLLGKGETKCRRSH